MTAPLSISNPGDLPRIARQAVEDVLTDSQPESLSAEDALQQSRGVFVTIHTRKHQLRGCRGTIVGSCSDLIEETRQNARSSAFDDPRFPAITLEELPNLQFEVSVLSEAEPVQNESDLDPKVYGVIVISMDGRKRALMLPGISQLDTVARQLSATRRKAGLTESEPIQLQRFRVDKYSE